MKKKNSLNLIKIFFLKEGVFWERTWQMKDKLGWVGFFIALIFIAIFHYLFAIMHFLFECFLWLTKRSQYKRNLVKLHTQLV